MIELITLIPLTGMATTVPVEQIENWDELQDVLVADQPYDFRINYNMQTYNGQLVLFTEDDDTQAVLLSFDRSVALPSKMCVLIDSLTSNTECPDVEIPLTEELKLQVVGEDGCPIGYVTIRDILSLVNIPNLCDLIGEDGIKDGNLVAEDKIVVTSGGCDLKAVDQSEITCD